MLLDLLCKISGKLKICFQLSLPDGSQACRSPPAGMAGVTLSTITILIFTANYYFRNLYTIILNRELFFIKFCSYFLKILLKKDSYS